GDGGLNDLPLQEEMGAVAKVASEKQGHAQISEKQNHADSDQRSSPIVVRGFFFRICLAFMHIHVVIGWAGAQRHKILLTISGLRWPIQRATTVLQNYKTRTSFRRWSTIFLAISAGAPSIISVFLLFCGTYNFSILIWLPPIADCTSERPIFLRGLFLACLMPIRVA